MSKSPSAGYIDDKWLKHRKKIKVDEILAVFQDWIALIKESDETPYSGLEINDLISIIERERNIIRTGEKVDYSELKKLFTPTGPIQELSIDNGWGQSFIELANRFDSAALFRS